MPNIVAALNACERVLDALRRYEDRDSATDALAREIEGARSALLARLYGGVHATGGT